MRLPKARMVGMVLSKISSPKWHGVVEDLVAEVAGTAVEGSHLGQRVGVGRLETLVGSHADGTAGRRDEDDVGAHLQDGLFALLETATVLGGRAVVPADVQVHDGGTGVDGRLGLAHDFLNGIRHIGILFLGDFCAADGGSDDQFIHFVNSKFKIQNSKIRLSPSPF